MRALLQRVAEASVEIDGAEVGRIGRGLVALLGVGDDDEGSRRRLLGIQGQQPAHLRRRRQPLYRSAVDVGADLLVVSQFTLYADTRRGRRPDFTRAAPPELALRLYEHTVSLFRATGLTVVTGRFQEYMQVRLQNDGPVTIMLDSADRLRPRR